MIAPGGEGLPAGDSRGEPPARRSVALGLWALAVAWMGLLFLASSQPGLRISDDATVDAPLRAAAHVVSYAVLGALLLGALLASGIGPSLGAALAILAAVAYGVSDEVHQSMVPERTGRLDDLVLDALGAAIGVVVGLAFTSAARRRVAPPHGG